MLRESYSADNLHLSCTFLLLCMCNCTFCVTHTAWCATLLPFEFTFWFQPCLYFWPNARFDCHTKVELFWSVCLLWLRCQKDNFCPEPCDLSSHTHAHTQRRAHRHRHTHVHTHTAQRGSDRSIGHQLSPFTQNKGWNTSAVFLTRVALCSEEKVTRSAQELLLLKFVTSGNQTIFLTVFQIALKRQHHCLTKILKICECAWLKPVCG